MINFEQKLPFRVHVGQPFENNVGRHIYQFRKLGKEYCPFKLYAPKDRFLPFQVFIPITEGATIDDADINDLFIFDCNGAYVTEMGNLPNLYSEFEIKQVYGEGIWFIYKGNNPIVGLNFSSGYYYFNLKTTNNREIYSELFYVDCNIDYSRFLKVEYWNTCDFANIIYQTGYKNRFYLDTTLLKGTPTIEETGFENGYGEFQMTSSRYVDNYALNYLVTEYMVHALLLMKSHDEIHITVPETGQTGKFEVKKPNVNWDDGAVYAEITLELEQEQRIYKGSCCENKIFSSVLKPLAVNNTYKMDLNKYDVIEWVNDYNNNHVSILNNDIGYGKSVKPSSVGTFATAQGGTIQIFANGTFKYEKPQQYQAQGSAPFTDSINYTMQDAYGTSSTATITFNFDFIAPVADRKKCVGSQVTFNILTNDFLPVSYNINPIIYAGSNPVVNQKITLYSANPQTLGNYIEIDIYTGVTTYHNVLGISSAMIFDLFTYRIYTSPGNLSASVKILITF